MSVPPPPRVAVVIPTYERAGYLREALDSVLAQTFPDLVVTVLDNASTDGTAKLVASYRDPRVSYVRHDTNVGLLANHNACLDHGTAVGADYLLLLSDDDVLRPDHLARTVAVLDGHPSAGMVHTRFDMVGPTGEVLFTAVNWTGGLEATTVETGEAFLAESMSWSCRICSSSTLLRTSALQGERFREQDFPAIDFGLWLRLAVRWDVVYLDEVLMAYRIHAASHSAALGDASAQGYRQDVDHVLRLHRLKERFLADHAGAPALRDLAGLRARARAAQRRELLVMARAATLPRRDRRATARALVEAARADPTVLALVPTWKLAGASLVGRRVLRVIAPSAAG